mgnify:CR=1 FL=1
MSGRTISYGCGAESTTPGSTDHIPYVNLVQSGMDQSMSRFVPGDVILARIRIGEKGEPKVRPAIVVREGDDGCLHAFPVSSTPSRDQRAVPFGLEDFQEGGLDIMDESYALTGAMIRIAPRDVAGKKGRLAPVALEAIIPGLGSGFR